MTLKINQEFHDLIPPLSDEEFAQLEKNIISDGCRDPLIVWHDVIIDGHNRYRICTDNSISFNTVKMEFDSHDAAKLWMINNQNGRRNMSDGWRFELSQAKKSILLSLGKEKMIANGGDRKSESAKSSLSTIDKLDPESHNTRDEIANDLGWSTGKVAMADKVWSEADDDIKDSIKSGEKTINQAYNDIKSQNKKNKLAEKKEDLIRQTAKDIKKNKPVLHHTDFVGLFNMIDDNSMDLLITDPPYSTDVDNINSFVDSWLFDALDKIKQTGRAYICIGAYPDEILAYLNKLSEQTRFIVDNPLIWTYRNTLGVTPKDKYNLNYQMILHLYTTDSPELDTSITNEMFSVQDINAPDGRQGDRYHTWQKPDELAMRLIRHGSKPGDKIFDPFTCTGTFPIAGSKLDRLAIGGDISEENLKIAQSRGCDVKFY